MEGLWFCSECEGYGYRERPGLRIPPLYSRLAVCPREPPAIRQHRPYGICGTRSLENTLIHKGIQDPQCSVALHAVLLGHRA